MKTTQKTEAKAIAKEAPADNNLLVEERRRHIRELVAERGRITVVDRKGLEHRACECYHRVRAHAERTLPAPAENGPCEML